MSPLHRLAAPGVRRILGALISGVAISLAGCATSPPGASAPTLPQLHDEWFVAAPLAAVAAVDPFALSDEMIQYAARELASPSPLRDPRRVLIDALYRSGGLRLEYENRRTRSAAEAFAARAGNCLSLVVMTAAFARHLGLPVSFQSVQIDDSYMRRGDLLLASGHVNLVLGRPPLLRRHVDDGQLTVDFLPQSELAGARVDALDERTLVAMYLNNRAAESLGDSLVEGSAAGHLDAAYAWARRAVLQDPGFAPAANTLAVIYSRAGHAEAAEAVLRLLLQREPDNIAALSNLVGLLDRAGRAGGKAEIQVLRQRLARLQPLPPFQEFEQGRQALAAGDARRAIGHFLLELRRQPDQDEVHFWAAQAYARLGDAEKVAHHLRLALASSGNAGSQARYAAKLASLRNAGLH
ncbi:Tetratricopeptide repeat protein [Rubrivivax sp. A210]|uniref:tetratricopeptide repeat protein n=1 Tax=Rubrivivax sp. A210 TaxID=2772301 RepID=UPI00191A248C|nr:tetratricopeptide repeat protein [Rubrivivax sp. A210]CAD5372975.1 Tetratricopeptide repeat protein [Rubrivivax sp. A210]